MPVKRSPAPTRSPAVEYLSLIADRIANVRRDVATLVKMGERMAELLLAGGDIYTPEVARYWPSEFGSRAGGLMGIRAEDRINPANPNNVAYFAVPRGAGGWDPTTDEKLKQLIASKSHLFVIGRHEELKNVAPRSRFAGFTGGAEHSAGLYGVPGGRRPLASLREFDQFVRGWIVAGEMIAACTRAGRMPIMWMSVWLEGAMVRNAHFFSHNNTREPWECPLFHEDHYVPPLARGEVAEAFLSEVDRLHATLIGQAGLLARSGQWLAEAKRAGKRIWTVAVGHSYPENLELDAGDAYPVEWGKSISDLSKTTPADLGDGDILLHLGYGPVNRRHVEGLIARGIRVIHTSPFGREADRLTDRRYLYFDLPWRPADATVDVPGYSVRILPMSSTAHTMALFAIVSEMGQRMGWR